jgi:hypothetical protein
MNLQSLFRRFARGGGPKARAGGRRGINLGPYSRLTDWLRSRRGRR